LNRFSDITLLPAAAILQPQNIKEANTKNGKKQKEKTKRSYRNRSRFLFEISLIYPGQQPCFVGPKKHVLPGETSLELSTLYAFLDLSSRGW
jgi:hypothetical protein